MGIHSGIKKRIHNHAKNLALEGLNSLNLPNSLLIIPDGNGRWAKNHNLSVSQGHFEGGRNMSEILDHFMKIGISVLGVWGFSEDNWKRPKEEIDRIMDVIQNTINDNLEKLIKNNVKFLVLGKRERIKKEYPNLYKAIENAVEKTKENTSKTLALFIDYGEKYQLEEFAKEREYDKNSSTYELLSKINFGIPLFDMILRTSGEQRLSGFGPLASLAEFVSVKDNLPEITDLDIVNALKEFSKRERRFGGR
ncbi:MAG TPA: polyprenyl diphosphate synthase [Candidatus Sulfotelmatobacter sp.]|nr:polyprenyl diphosphate synthase [Candidatus Sulfotelmatobacter sp.]